MGCLYYCLNFWHCIRFHCLCRSLYTWIKCKVRFSRAIIKGQQRRKKTERWNWQEWREKNERAPGINKTQIIYIVQKKNIEIGMRHGCCWFLCYSVMNFRFFSSLGNRWCENEHRITVFVKCYTYFDYYIVDVVRFALEYKMRYACNVDIFVVILLFLFCCPPHRNHVV